jgi:hypothetical protein
MGKIMNIDLQRQLPIGFVSGFIAVLVFHQLTLLALWSAGIAPFGPFSMAPTMPFGVPAVLSLAFWGGVWGILFVLVHNGFPKHTGYWITAFVFGAVLLSAVALMIVLPLKGRPMGGGWHMNLLLTAFLINGAWGIGTALIHKVLSGRLSRLRGAEI